MNIRGQQLEESSPRQRPMGEAPQEGQGPPGTVEPMMMMMMMMIQILALDLFCSHSVSSPYTNKARYSTSGTSFIEQSERVTVSIFCDGE